VSRASLSFLPSCQLLWVAFVVGVVALAAVVTFFAPVSSTVPVGLPAALALAVGAAVVTGVLAIERLFASAPPADDLRARSDYRMRLVLQAVLAEAATALGVLLAVVFGPAWIAAIGGGGGLVALIAVRPSRPRFERLEAAWSAQGADVSLIRDPPRSAGAGRTGGADDHPGAPRP
jgi:hypothetical protein